MVTLILECLWNTFTITVFLIILCSIFESILRRLHGLEAHAQKLKLMLDSKWDEIFMPELDRTENIKVAFIALIFKNSNLKAIRE
jgi:hypothetical protein